MPPCDDLVQEVMQGIQLAMEVYPNEIQQTAAVVGLDYLLTNEVKMKKWLCHATSKLFKSIQ